LFYILDNLIYFNLSYYLL